LSDGAAHRPLGVFDSGLGGLTVVRALRSALPEEHIVYLGDNARIPYGTRSAETVVRYARGCARALTGRGVKALVVACNTVSAVALDMLRAELDLPVIGVVEPGARAAVRAIEGIASGHAPPKIGVLGTRATIASGAYGRAVAQLSTRLEVIGQAAPLLVPLVEEGWLEGEVPELTVRRYLAPLIEAGAGVLVLGCTHYPLLAPLIAAVAREIAGREIPVVDSAHATAEAVLELGRDSKIGLRGASAPEGRLDVLVTDLPASFEALARSFLGSDLGAAEQIDL
jgi:glutamate racemase